LAGSDRLEGIFGAMTLMLEKVSSNMVPDSMPSIFDCGDVGIADFTL